MNQLEKRSYVIDSKIREKILGLRVCFTCPFIL